MKKLLTLIATMIMYNAYGEEPIIFYVDNSVTTSSRCTSGGNITKPNDPTKTGYRFIGWQQKMTLNQFLEIKGTSYTPTSANSSTTWTTTFPYGTISGSIMCSSTNGGSQGSTGNPTGSGKYCWCKLTNAGALAGAINVSNSAWVHDSARGSNAADCNKNCASFCGALAAGNSYSSYSAWRKALFGF